VDRHRPVLTDRDCRSGVGSVAIPIAAHGGLQHSGPSTSGPVPFVYDPNPEVAPVNLGSRPTKALDDAIYSTAALLNNRDVARRKVILLISDGINGEQFNHHTYKNTLETLVRENISVYSLAVGST
jgi:hypothetical protein